MYSWQWQSLVCSDGVVCRPTNTENLKGWHVKVQALETQNLVCLSCRSEVPQVLQAQVLPGPQLAGQQFIGPPYQ